MSRIYKVALGLKLLTGAMLILFSRRIINMMTGNANAPSPNPTMVALTDATDTYETAKQTLEQGKINLKSMAADEQQKRRSLELLITTEGRYVDSVALGDKAIIEGCGMPASDQPSPIHLDQVEDLSLTRGDNPGSVDAHWHAIAKSSGYTIETSNTAPDMTGHAPWAYYKNSTKSSITISGLTSGTIIWVHVCANGAGDSRGGFSDPALLIVP